MSIYSLTLYAAQASHRIRLLEYALDTDKRFVGQKQYELTDHLGNALGTVSNHKTYANGHYNAVVLSAQDYYPFGSIMPGRSYNSNASRYGFNGMEKDDEIAGSGNSYTAMFWQYDARLGRRWNVDPVVKYHESPYAAFANNPIWFIDPSGADSSKVGELDVWEVDKGDTYSSISERTGVSVENLRNWNGYEDTKIPIGAKLLMSDPNEIYKNIQKQEAAIAGVNTNVVDNENQNQEPPVFFEAGKVYSVNLKATGYAWGGKYIGGLGGGEVEVNYQGEYLSSEEFVDAGAGFSLNVGFTVQTNLLIFKQTIRAHDLKHAMSQIKLIEGSMHGTLGGSVYGTLYGYSKAGDKQPIFEGYMYPAKGGKGMVGWDYYQLNTEIWK